MKTFISDIANLVEERGHISTRGVAFTVGCSMVTARKHLRTLAKQGVVEQRVDATKLVWWWVTPGEREFRRNQHEQQQRSKIRAVAILTELGFSSTADYLWGNVVKIPTEKFVEVMDYYLTSFSDIEGLHADRDSRSHEAACGSRQ